MFELTEDSLGKLKSWIKRHSVEDFFGTNPRGEIINPGRGGEVKGPAILPRRSSLLILAATTGAWISADVWFV